jgi:DNA-binding PadR family transcriptional regulator
MWLRRTQERPAGTASQRTAEGVVPITKFDKEDMKYKDLLTGFIRLHILHHAAEHEIYGQWMIEELARHGYKLSPGTLYPLLHGMERKGYLRSRKEHPGRTARTLYRATPLGKRGLALAKSRVLEFTGEAIRK